MSREEKLALLRRLAEEGAAGGRDQGARSAPAEDAPQEGTYPVSFAQRRLWFLDRLEPGGFQNTIFRAIRLRGPLDRRALTGALEEIISRHGTLRTRFEEADGEPRQVVEPVGSAAAASVGVVDLSNVVEPHREERLVALARAEATGPFDLERGTLARFRLVLLGEDHAALLIAVHHIVADGWSLGILLRELSTLYGARTDPAATPALPRLATGYGTYARRQRERLSGERLERELDLWRKLLAGAPDVLDLPTDRPRPALETFRGAVETLRLDETTVSGLVSLARGERATPFMVLATLFAGVLARWAGRDDLLLGTPIAGRPASDLEPLIGLFANTLVLRADLSASPTFREALGRVRTMAVEAFGHQEMPFERLVEELVPERDLSRNPLFQVMFALQNQPPASLHLGEASVEPLAVERGLSKVDLTLDLVERDGAVAGYLEYNVDLFDRTTVQRLARALERCARAVAADPDRAVDRLPVVGPVERHLLEVEWQGPTPRAAVSREEETPLAVHEAFFRRAAEHPDRTAVEDGTERRTYGDLARAAARVARGLREAGVGPEDRVGVFAERSAEGVAAFLGVLAAGAAYVPLDPDYPDDRLAFMAADAAVRALLALPGELDGGEPVARTREIAPTGAPVLALNGAELFAPAGPDDRDGVDPPEQTPAGRSAYVIYTSGTTGRPKGVVVPHGALANHAAAIASEYGLGPADRVLQFASISFDIAAEEIYPTLGSGAALVLRPRELSLEPAALARFVADREITVANIPTPLWHEWCLELDTRGGAVDGTPPGVEILPPESLRLVVVGTEGALPERLSAWLRALAASPGRAPRWVNAYGPTEATITSLVHAREVGKGPWKPGDGPPARVPIGRPIAGLTAHVLDPFLDPVPIGAPGELCLGGAGLARGYLGRPDETAATFVPAPVGGGMRGARLYRTGDLARVRPDGSIEFLGRTDDQVKIRGFRVEPGEIEAVLAEDRAVREVAVLALEAGPGDRRLVAYVVPDRPPGGEVERGTDDSSLQGGVEGLRERLGARLPAYMVPAAFVTLESLPLTPAGKVDRRALPAPDWAGTDDGGARVAPRGPVEELLAGIWREVLEVERLGAEDDFFRLGGHSLLATRVLARVRDRLGVEVPLRTLFEAPTVRALAGAVERLREGVQGGAAARLPALEPGLADVEEGAPLSFAQQRLWFLDRLEPESAQYSMPTRLEVMPAAGRALDFAALHRALGEIVRRHESLRTVFPEEGREPVQRVLPAGAPALPLIDLGALPAGRRGAEAGRLALEEGRRPFALDRGPLARFHLVRTDGEAGAHELLITIHHIVSDGWSIDLLLTELVVLYRAFAAEEPSPLSALPVQYADFAVWQRRWLAGETLDRQVGFWRQALDGLPGLLELPTDRPRPPAPTGRGGRWRFRLPEAAGEAVSRLTREGATPYMVLAAAFAAVLFRQSGQGDFAFGTPVAGRGRTALEPLIGFFANTLVLRMGLGDDPSFRDLLARVRGTVLDAHGHQDLPFEKLVEELQPERNLSHHPLFQVLFAYQEGAGRVVDGGDGSGPHDGSPVLRLLPGDNDTARFDLALNVWPMWPMGQTRPTGQSRDGGFAGFLEYATDLFDRTTAGRMVAQMGELLAGAGRAPEGRVSELPLLAAAERQAVVREWNDTGAPFPSELCLHELVAAQMERTPDRVALVHGGDHLTYSALDRRIEILARCLRTLGVRAGSVVGVCVERSLELVVALHAVVRAGGAYLPLDPDYPTDRLAFMLEDAATPVVLTQERLLASPDTPVAELLRGLETERGTRVLRLDRDWREIEASAAETASGAPGAAGPGDTAYVIYTSGSTGRPKGVMVPHRGIVNRLIWMQRAYPLGESDRVLQKTPFSFDVSVWELFWPFLVGARLEMAEPGRHGDPMYLAAALKERRITTLHFVPSMLQVFLEARDARGLDAVRRVIASGEALPPSLAGRFFERLPESELHNLYGPTEASVDVSYHRCLPEGEERVPIGRPIENIRLHVLDRWGRPAPIGVPGELHLGGVGLAQGYLARPGLTAERFVPDSLSPDDSGSGGRLYRTGDLCRWLPDGEVEFLGRIDFQVKVRGLRIELGEIEAALSDHPAVREVVVTARDDGPAGALLVAYLVTGTASGDGAETAAEPPSITELRAWVGRSLPEYMIPGAFVLLDAFPLSPNGKVDRRALPDPGDARPDLERELVLPRTPVEEDLAAIWREVLRVDRVGVEDNFFELGGHSLLATQVVTRIEERFGVELPVRALFETPRIAALAERIVDSGLDELDDDELARLLAELDDTDDIEDNDR